MQMDRQRRCMVFPNILNMRVITVIIAITVITVMQASAQIPSLTSNSLIKFKEGNTVFDRTVGDVFSTIDIDLTTGVTGILPVANGGTGVSSVTANRILYGNGTSALQTSANLTFSGTNLALGGVTAVSMIEGPSSNTNSTLKIGKAELQSFTGGDANILLMSNAYYNTAFTRRADGYSSVLQMYNGEFLFRTSETSSTAGSTFTGKRVFTASTTGYFNIGDVAAGTVAASLGIVGQGATSATHAIICHNSGGTNNQFVVRNDGRVGIGLSAPGYALDVTQNSTASQLHFSGTNTDNGGYLVSAGASNFFMAAGASYNGTNWVAKATSASVIGGGATAGELTFYNNTGLTIGNTFTVTERARIDADGDMVIGVGTAAARLHAKGAGNTSGTDALLIENSDGTDIFRVRNDQVSAFGTTPVATEKLLVRGATSDNTTKVFIAERSSGTDVLGAQNDGKVSINNAAYTEELTINGQAQLDGVIFTNVTGSTTASGHVVYNNGAGGTYSGYLTVGDGTRQLAIMPTMIERHVIDYGVDWTEGRKGAFWTVPARFDGWKIAKAYIEVTSIGSGAGDDELTIEISGVGEGVQIVTAGTHTLVMDDVVNTDDVVTFNVTTISATPAKGLHVSLELSKN